MSLLRQLHHISPAALCYYCRQGLAEMSLLSCDIVVCSVGPSGDSLTASSVFNSPPPETVCDCGVAPPGGEGNATIFSIQDVTFLMSTLVAGQSKREPAIKFRVLTTGLRVGENMVRASEKSVI